MKTLDIKKVLVPLDFSETSLLALDHASYMARLFNAQLILLHVVAQKWTVFNRERMEIVERDMQEHLEFAEREMRMLAENIRTTYELKDVEYTCATGNVSRAIVNYAEKKGVNIIVMGTHGASGFEEKFIGSNAYRVVNDSSCPVITIQSHRIEKGFYRLLLPIDESIHSMQKVDPAVELAKKYHSTIRLLGLAPPHDPAEITEASRRLDRVEGYLTHRGIPTEHSLLTGTNYAKLTMEMAREKKMDLVVIMTEWEKEVTGIFIGPFARQVVNHCPIPVMTIRPEVKEELIPSKVAYY